MPGPDPTKFVADCWTIVRGRGRQENSIAARAQIAWGLEPAGATCYRDKLIEIVAEAKPSQRILVTKRDTNTPIVCTDKEGVLFRWHGEYVKIAAHVRVLAIGLQND